MVLPAVLGTERYCAIFNEIAIDASSLKNLYISHYAKYIARVSQRVLK